MQLAANPGPDTIGSRAKIEACGAVHTFDLMPGLPEIGGPQGDQGPIDAENETRCPVKESGMDPRYASETARPYRALRDHGCGSKMWLRPGVASAALARAPAGEAPGAPGLVIGPRARGGPREATYRGQDASEARVKALAIAARLLLPVIILLLAAPALAQPAITAFIRVNVLPMDQERVLRDQVVIVSDARIQAIGPRLKVPRDARVIDGGGTAWLLPGLADMHVHAQTRNELALMLANGITTALDLGEAPNALIGRTRAAVARGDVAGPRLFAALAVDGSPQYGHLVVATPEAARWAVRLARANGYDFIKAYNNLAPDVFSALIAEGRQVGLPVVGHNVERMGIERQVAGGQVMIAHLEEFLYGYFRLPEGAGPHAVPDETEIARAVDFVRKSGVVVTADLATYEAIEAQWGRPAAIERYLRMPEMRYLAPEDRVAWRGSGYARRKGSLAARAAFLARFVRAMAQAGIPLIAGTDAPTVPGLASGFGLHRHLASLEAAGLSRYQVLATATQAPGAFIARTHPEAEPFGTVAVGQRADLLLVAADPLESLATLTRPIGVMAGGRWHAAADLQALLSDVARNNETAILPKPCTQCRE